MMDGKVVLITGAAGTGKSTLVRSLLERARPFRQVDYGQLLRKHKLREAGVQISYDELRRDSGAVISPEDVMAVDEWLINQLPQWRTEGNIVVDSHPVSAPFKCCLLETTTIDFPIRMLPMWDGGQA
jgi:adenylate kinase